VTACLTRDVSSVVMSGKWFLQDIGTACLTQDVSSVDIIIIGRLDVLEVMKCEELRMYCRSSKIHTSLYGTLRYITYVAVH
jgi:hypothetical protein